MSYVEGGAATALLSDLAEGGTVDASGPYGRFCLMDADTNQRYLLVATGTGVTPYRAMLPKIREAIATRGCTFALVYGARNEGELLYGEEFEAFAREVPGFTFHPCFSRADARDAAPERSQRARARCAGGAQAGCGERHRVSVRQSGHGRSGVCTAQGSGLAGAAYPA